MLLSIRLWTLIALNGLIIAVSAVQGWIAQDVAGKVVEQRVAKEMSASVSSFLASRSFPLSNAMMGYLREILNEDWIAVRNPGWEILGSSLSESLTQDFHGQIRTAAETGTITLGGNVYRIDSCDVPANKQGANSSLSQPTKLYVLIPNAKLQEVRNRASRGVAGAVLPSALAATLIAMMLASAVTRPIRRLATEMDKLSGSELVESDSMPHQPQRERGESPATTGGTEQRRLLTSKGPKETRLLATSFYALLDRLAAARHQLMQADRLATLGRICLSVAHELRNPLSGIKMNMRVLRDRIQPPDDLGVDAIVREVDRMGLYLDELMSFAPSARTDGAGKPARVKLSALADSVLTILAGRCRHAGAVVEKVYPIDEPPVSCEANPIRQTMMNFIVNAIESMPDGGRITVTIRPGPSTISFFVSDTGGGVRASDPDIFEAFATDKSGGAGLGLYLSRQIVQRHGGRIGYENTETGATFWFELPTVSICEPTSSTALGEARLA